MTAGHCTICGEPIWRRTAHPVTGELVLLYPMPSSVYAWVLLRPEPRQVSPGIGYCPAHRPNLGDPGPALPGAEGTTRIVGLQTAATRYGTWFSEPWGTNLRAWLDDELHLSAPARDAVMQQWAQDRHEALHG